MSTVKTAPAETDAPADEVISACLNPARPRNFFLFAGAGSGKTRSLKLALEHFRFHHGAAFRRSGKKVAVITYTNAAADEISARVGSDSLFPVSTIHSFCWRQIGHFHRDIQDWLLKTLPGELADIRAKHAKGRAGKAAMDRERAMAAIESRLARLGEPRKFTYNPNGNNFGADSLSHAEVLQITAAFIEGKPAMQRYLVDQYPFILVDESQDTNRDLLQSLFVLSQQQDGCFGLGLFGDTMQRIYMDGLPSLGNDLPPGWALPHKAMNHRSARRVIDLANAIRREVDGREQFAREDSMTGVVRFFVIRGTYATNPLAEDRIRARMLAICGDPDWGVSEAVKTLTLEHHMAARRGGFLPMFEALDKDSRLSTSLRTGELAGLRLFTECVLPLLRACETGDRFGAMNVLRKQKSPLLQPAAMAGATADPLKEGRTAVEALKQLVHGEPNCSFDAVLQCVAGYGLFQIPASLLPFVSVSDDLPGEPSDGEQTAGAEPEEEEDTPSSAAAWRSFLETAYAQIRPYAEYVEDRAPYGTHQGVKGLEFDRVLVVVDDNEARGFLFSYGKLFGTTAATENDRRRAADGEETGVDRTRRLLYVTATRAKESLAVAVYSDNPEQVRTSLAERGWVGPDEVELLE